MALRMTEEEFAAFQARNRRHSTFSAEQKEIPTKRSKYGNRRVEVDGIKFDSQHEATIYQELMLRVRAGELKAVLRQVSFDLPGGIRYVADFVTIGRICTSRAFTTRKALAPRPIGCTSTRGSR